MATGREQATAAGVALGVPAELPVPRADAVVVVDLTVVNFAQQPAINHRLRGEELARVAALETNARLHAGLGYGTSHGSQILEVERQWFLDDQVLAGCGCGDDLFRVLVRITADRDNVDRRIGEHSLQVGMALDFAAVLCAEFGGVQLARGVNRRDLPLGGAVNRVDMRPGHPAITDHANIKFLHQSGEKLRHRCHNEPARLSTIACKPKSRDVSD